MLSPFERLHQTPLHALAVLTRENNAFLAPGITIKLSLTAIQYDFPDVIRANSQRTIPSSLCLSDLSMELKYYNPLFFSSSRSDNTRAHRPLLDLSLKACEIEWCVVDNEHLETPRFLNRAPVGIMYEVSIINTSKHDHASIAIYWAHMQRHFYCTNRVTTNLHFFVLKLRLQ